MKPFRLGGRSSLKPLSISRSSLQIRDVYFTKVPFGALIVLVQGYFCLYFGLCLRIRSKVMTNCTDDQIKTLTQTNLILRKLIRQTPTNRSEGNALYSLTPCLFTVVLVSCRQKLSSRNQGRNRAPGSWKSHFGIGSRSENSMNGMTPPLYPFPLTFQPVSEASCRPPSPLPKSRSIRIPCWWRREW